LLCSSGPPCLCGSMVCLCRSSRGLRRSLWVAFLVHGITAAILAAPADCFAIKVTDAATGRGVPLVELRTVNDSAWWTDSNGVAAFDEPGLMGTEVYLHVRSPGYELAADMLGFRGVKLKPTRGGS